MAAKWLYEWRHHVEYDPNDGDYRGIELCRESATELLALLDAERPVVAWEHEYECGHFDVEAGKDPVPWEMCPWECGANLKASRPLTYKEATDG